MYYLQHERPCCIGRYEGSSYKPTGEKSLEIDEVYAEKIKVKVYVNQQKNCIIVYRQ